MTVSVLCLYVMVPWVGLQCVVVAFLVILNYFACDFILSIILKAHTVIIINRALLEARKTNVLPWPYCYPDRNPIEHICDVNVRKF